MRNNLLHFGAYAFEFGFALIAAIAGVPMVYAIISVICFICICLWRR
nr:MAG TPA: hypothetical protein [Caudoviricetes sp.]